MMGGLTFHPSIGEAASEASGLTFTPSGEAGVAHSSTTRRRQPTHNAWHDNLEREWRQSPAPEAVRMRQDMSPSPGSSESPSPLPSPSTSGSPTLTETRGRKRGATSSAVRDRALDCPDMRSAQSVVSMAEAACDCGDGCADDLQIA